MTQVTYPNWLHLDLKGVVPTQRRLLKWLKYFSSLGYDAILWEYEDRFPWKSWPGVFRGAELGYTLEGWREIWGTSRDLGMQNIPLIQTQGHLEWLLKHDAYVHWREDGHINELCPNHPEVMPRLKSWIDEVIAIHPDSAYVCVGGDETWNLASCPRCQQRAKDDPNGKLSVYLDHVGAICRYTLDSGVTPMIWADMFWREKRTDLAAELPEGTVLIDWQYAGAGPWETVAELAGSGRELWGASAIRSSYDYNSATLSSLTDRIRNVTGWREQGSRHAVKGLIHTTWGRSRSLLPLYGPWEGWVPCFVAAGSEHPARQSVLHDWVSRVDEAMNHTSAQRCVDIIKELEKIPSDALPDEYERNALRWWILSLRYKLWYTLALGASLGYQSWLQAAKAVGMDPDWQAKCVKQRSSVKLQLDAWERDARAFWEQCELSDADEFFAGRLAPIRSLLDHVWRDANSPSVNEAQPAQTFSSEEQ